MTPKDTKQRIRKILTFYSNHVWTHAVGKKDSILIELTQSEATAELMQLFDEGRIEELRVVANAAHAAWMLNPDPKHKSLIHFLQNRAKELGYKGQFQNTESKKEGLNRE